MPVSLNGWSKKQVDSLKVVSNGLEELDRETGELRCTLRGTKACELGHPEERTSWVYLFL